MVQITVRTLTGQRLRIECDPLKDTFADLKRKIEHVEGIPPVQQRLVYGGKDPYDDRILGDYNVQGGSTIDLILKAPTPFEDEDEPLVRRIGSLWRPNDAGSVINVLSSERPTERYFVSYKATVNDLKDTIAKLRNPGIHLSYRVVVLDYVVPLADGSKPISGLLSEKSELSSAARPNVRLESVITVPYSIIASTREEEILLENVIYNDTILNIKELLAPRLKVQPNVLRISFKEIERLDSDFLVDVQIDPGSTIKVRRKDEIDEISNSSSIWTMDQIGGFDEAEELGDMPISINWTPPSRLSNPYFSSSARPHPSPPTTTKTSLSRPSRSSTLSYLSPRGVRNTSSFRKPSTPSDEIDVVVPHPRPQIGLTQLPYQGLKSHMFPDRDARDDWELLQSELPAGLQYRLHFNNTHNGTPCWTYIPDDLSELDDTLIPLAIARAPIVIAVPYRWPPTAGVSPPPDPHPHFINPAAPITTDTIKAIFETFQDILGFYLLLNGLLQLIVPEHFDREWASSHLPNRFGGLQICYILQTICPTANRAPGTTGIATSDARASNLGINRFSFLRPQRTAAEIVALPLQLNSFVEVRKKNSRTEERYRGRIGLKTTSGNKTYLVVSTHVILDAIKPKRSWFNPSIMSKLRGSHTSLNGDWADEVDILGSGCAKIGKVVETFDPHAKDYPIGYVHDITLVEPFRDLLVSEVRSPVPDLGWLSRAGWQDLRQRPSPVRILGSVGRRSHIAKSMKSDDNSECMIIGEGILRNQRPFIKPGNAKEAQFEYREHTDWSELIDRCVLYRVSPDFDEPTGQSGMALYTEGPRQHGTHGPGVVGFQSFVQRAQLDAYDLEGEHLRNRLKLGQVAFYGAFQVPAKMMDEHDIV